MLADSAIGPMAGLDEICAAMASRAEPKSHWKSTAGSREGDILGAI
jgi:hypothetical protein